MAPETKHKYMDQNQNREKITLKMTAKGAYYWDIEVLGTVDVPGGAYILNGTEVTRLKLADETLKQNFPNNTTTTRGGE